MEDIQKTRAIKSRTFKNKLMASKGKKLIHNMENDGNGRNEMGAILERIRDWL